MQAIGKILKYFSLYIRDMFRIIYNKTENEEISATSSNYKHTDKTVQVKNCIAHIRK